jgi:hypothetical protein
MAQNYLRTHVGRHRTHKSKVRRVLKEKWEIKVMHGLYIRDSLLVEKTGLSRGDLNGENESEIMAAQDQALQIKYHAIKILQTETDSK